MKKRKLFLKIIFIFSLIISFSNNVKAAENEVSCYYPINSNSATIKYNANTGEISGSTTLTSTSISLNISGASFVNADSSFKCPSAIYWNIGVANGRQAQLSIYDNKGSCGNCNSSSVDLSKSSIPQKTSNLKVCVVSGCNFTASITVDLDKKTINGYNIEGYNANGDLHFEDIIKDGKCRTDAIVYITCARGYCGVNRTGECEADTTGSSDPGDIDNSNDGDNDSDVNSGPIRDQYIGNTSCGGIRNFTFHKRLPDLTSTAYTILKVAIPIILIVKGMIDMFKAMSAGKEDEMKKAQKKFVQRLIASICAFLVFMIVETITEWISDATDNEGAMSCVNCFINGSKHCEEVTAKDK